MRQSLQIGATEGTRTLSNQLGRLTPCRWATAAYARLSGLYVDTDAPRAYLFFVWPEMSDLHGYLPTQTACVTVTPHSGKTVPNSEHKTGQYGEWITLLTSGRMGVVILTIVFDVTWGYSIGCRLSK